MGKTKKMNSKPRPQPPTVFPKPGHQAVRLSIATLPAQQPDVVVPLPDSYEQARALKKAPKKKAPSAWVKRHGGKGPPTTPPAGGE